MKTLYIDCGMGAAGDMLTAALMELLPDPVSFLAELNTVGIPGVVFEREPSVKCGIRGTHIAVKIHGGEEDDSRPHEHSHTHADLQGIEHIVSRLRVPATVKADVMNVYRLIAEAESAVHGVPVSEIHFHEVGTLDAIADVTAVCLLMARLAPDTIVASPVCTGSGEVRCAHGILPVPAPATAYLLRGIPMYDGTVTGELCTPTGAALLKYFAKRFGPMPVMRTTAIGYGMGKRDYERANCVRVFFGETDGARDTVAVLSCNVDDMTAEEIGYAMERLLEAGAKDVFTVPIGMKKNRPGTLIRVICAVEDKDAMARLMFRYTSTIGIRETEMGRFVLDRASETRDTPYGPVRVKKVSGCGVSREKIEYDDLARIAKEQDVRIADVRARIERTEL